MFNSLHLAVFILGMGLPCSPCAHTSGWLPVWSPFLCCPSLVWVPVHKHKDGVLSGVFWVVPGSQVLCLMGYFTILAVLVNWWSQYHSLMRLCMKGCFFFLILNLPPSLNIQKIKGSKGAARVLWLNGFPRNAFFCCQLPSFALQTGPVGKISFSW